MQNLHFYRICIDTTQTDFAVRWCFWFPATDTSIEQVFSPLDQARSQVLRFGGKNIFRGKYFYIYIYIFETIFSRNKKFWDHKKIGGHCPRMPQPRSYGPFLNYTAKFQNISSLKGWWKTLLAEQRDGRKSKENGELLVWASGFPHLLKLSQGERSL